MNITKSDFVPIGQDENTPYTYRSNTGTKPVIGHPHDQSFITKLKTPRLLTKSLLRVYQTEFEGLGRREANLNHLKRKSTIKDISNGLRLTTEESEIKQQAIFHVDAITRALVRGVSAAMSHIETYGLPFPYGVAEREAKLNGGYIAINGPTFKRLTNDRWMTRALRKEIRRRIEHIALDQGVINMKIERYASDQTVLIHEQNRKRNYDLLKSMEAINEEGDTLSLLELNELSVSNPYIRNSELLVRLRGFENYSDKHNHYADFWTLTCPSKFHRSSKKWNGLTPKDAQRWLCKQWARFRSALKRAGFTVYGFRVAEPHRDGCPHWHMLLFFESDEALQFSRHKMEHYLLSEDGNEKGADEHRFNYKLMDKAVGTATGYIAKYITKNIDGANIQDVDGRDPVHAALRTNTWASNWSIRQFQQIGGPSVTVWRELRRMECEETGALEQCRDAADKSDWCGYFEAQGGHKVNYHDMPVKPAYWLELDPRINDIPLNEYGEPIGSTVFGLTYDSTYYLTRFHTWKLQKKEDIEPIDRVIEIHPDSPVSSSGTHIRELETESNEDFSYTGNFPYTYTEFSNVTDMSEPGEQVDINDCLKKGPK
ncbi:MAG: replication endonuclease [Methylococcales bacterium]